jgi:hypothetical protein
MSSRTERPAESRSSDCARSAGEFLLRDAALRSVAIDVERGRIRLRCERTTVTFDGIRATTLLGPWDGASGEIEHVKVLSVDAGETCLEVRVRFATVPRVYRVVCREVRVARRGD